MKKKLFFLCFLLICSIRIDAQSQDSVVGIASYYANRFHGRKTASGEIYDKNGYTCAHLKYKLGTLLKVKHLDSGKEVIVKVTDRGPYSKKFTIDLSYAAAKDLGIIRAGHARVAIIPYNEKMEHPKQEAKIPSFLECRSADSKLPHDAYKDTMHIKPLLLPVTDTKTKK